MKLESHSETTRSTYVTAGGLRIEREQSEIPIDGAIESLVGKLDGHRGAVLTSGVEFPGRYTRWDMGFVDPPLVLTAAGRAFKLNALNDRGELLLRSVEPALRATADIAELTASPRELVGTVRSPGGPFREEDRSRQPTALSVVRAITAFFYSDEDAYLGLYGAFGYDLAFQFEPVAPRMARSPRQRDLVLYLPDELVLVDHQRARAVRAKYFFEYRGTSTRTLTGGGKEVAFVPAKAAAATSEFPAGGYADLVRVAQGAFKRGELFEVVPGQTFSEPANGTPAEIFERLRVRNPSPYGFMLNLGDQEYLVGASPEMYVRVDGRRVETCPISGTIARGTDPIDDAAQILALLSSRKDESELTMCTDVDRNDKSRVCEPGSVRVLGRRQVEMYSRLIHTVDHVEGKLRPEFDALDAFLAHAWAVTVTGAPKTWAMRFIEEREKSPRCWYGGAVGFVGFAGQMNTGLTLRTIRIVDGIAEVRVGATLLFDSIPEDEEKETHTKAAALFDAIRNAAPPKATVKAGASAVGAGKRVLLVDHEDSFVHTLANYFRQTGAEVVTLRAGFRPSAYDELTPHLLVLSPGPGRPSDFDVSGTLAAARERKIPVFGVCLGLQGMVEHFGGDLAVLDAPVHGKASTVRVQDGVLFRGMDAEFLVGRYHSLYAVRQAVPSELRITAETDDGIVMAVEHATEPLAAVQFHPESILSLPGNAGMRIIENVVAHLARS
jgi:anthranilate synthase